MTKMSFDKDTMRARFWDLKHAVDAAEGKITILREKYEPGWNADLERRRTETAEIRAVEKEILPETNMFDAKQEMAFLARGLGQVVGSDPALEPSEVVEEVQQA